MTQTFKLGVVELLFTFPLSLARSFACGKVLTNVFGWTKAYSHPWTGHLDILQICNPNISGCVVELFFIMLPSMVIYTYLSIWPVRKAAIHHVWITTTLLWCSQETHEYCKVSYYGKALRNSYQSTPLHFAAQGGHIAVVKLLTIEMHCNPTSRIANDLTALHCAVVNGHLDIGTVTQNV